MDMLKLTFENEQGVFSVAIREEMLPLEGVIDQLVVPVLLAATYSPQVIAKYVKSELVGGCFDEE